MRNLSPVIPFVTVISLIAVSCAKEATEDTKYLEALAFNAWMEKNVINEGKSVARQDNGIYIEFIDDGDQSPNAVFSKDTIVWLKMNYTATDLHNNVFVTRNEQEALRQATFTPYTYYSPDYLFCGEENYSMITGQYYALKNDLVKPDGTTIKLSSGSKVRIYMPSYLAFGSSGYSDDQGYGGQYSLSGSEPVIEELEIVEVVKDPVLREEKLVVEYAMNEWDLAETDTLTQFFYVDTLKFNQELSLKHGKDLSKPFKEEYALGVDSTAKIWFVGKFMDGFIFDTNIDTVYTRFYNRRAYEGYYADDKTMSVLSYTPENDQSSYISAFYEAIPNLRRGQWSRIIFTSAYGYGATGLSAALQQQADYYNYYMSYLYNSSYGYGSNYYGNSYYGNSYYDSYYNNYYNYGYYDYSTSSDSEIVTEIQPYTPLIFELYIESDDDDED